MNTPKSLYNKWKKFFLINLLVGVFSFFMLISLQLLNHLDAIWHYGYGGAGNWERGLGRWFLPYVDKLRFGLLTDPFCNVLALAIFILGNIVVFETIGWAPDKFRTYAVSFIFLISTSTGVWLSFRYTSDGYAIAYLFAVLTVYMCRFGVKSPKLPRKLLTTTVNTKEASNAKEAPNAKESPNTKEATNTADSIFSVILASVCLMLSLGSYQAFFDSTCLVMLLTFMLMLYKNEDTKELLSFFLRSVISIICGAILYFIGMKLTFAKYGIEGLNSYNEGDSLGIFNSILNIPDTIGTTIHYFREYFFSTVFRWNRLQENPVFRIFICILIIATLITAIVRLFRKNRVFAILFTLCALLLPIATNVVLFVATESYLSIQMTNGLALFLFVMFVLMFEILTTDEIHTTHCRRMLLQKVVNATVIAASVLVIYGNYISVQIDQEACREGTTGTVTLASEMLDSLKNLGYADKGGKVCFVGTPCHNERFMYSEIYPMANNLMQFGNWGKSASTHGQTWIGIYREHLGYFVETCSDEEYEKITARPDVAAMPMYPRAGSITEIDGIIVIKVSNDY